MRFKYDVAGSLSGVDMVYMNEATRLAELLKEERVTYYELIQLREYFSLTNPRYYKELFDMIEECLLRMSLEKEQEV